MGIFVCLPCSRKHKDRERHVAPNLDHPCLYCRKVPLTLRYRKLPRTAGSVSYPSSQVWWEAYRKDDGIGVGTIITDQLTKTRRVVFDGKTIDSGTEAQVTMTVAKVAMERAFQRVKAELTRIVREGVGACR